MSVISDFFRNCKNGIQKFFRSTVQISSPASIKKRIGKWKFNRVEKRAMKVLPVISDEVPPAIERLTNQLIDETVGEKGDITMMIRRHLKDYSPDSVPLGAEQAEALLLSALKIAVSRRKLLNERLSDCVEMGSLYQAYYSRVHLVSTTTIEAYEMMEQMQLAEEDYRYKEELLKKVRDNNYKSEFNQNSTRPADETEKKDPDIMAAVVKGGR